MAAGGWPLAGAARARLPGADARGAARRRCGTRSDHAALYFPRLRQPNPFRGDAPFTETNRPPPLVGAENRDTWYGAAAAWLAETFEYDLLNRLTSYTTTSPAISQGRRVAIAYNAIGNIASRSDLGTFAYAPSGTSSARPGAVTGISGGAGGTRSYAYDAAGNMIASTGGKYTAIRYTSFKGAPKGDRPRVGGIPGG